jgi:hypothetical protein
MLQKPDASDSAAETVAEPDAPLKPPQFTLRTLLVAMTVVGLLMGLMTTVGPVWSLPILLVLALVGAHVIGNALGTRLRDHATRDVLESAPPPRVAPLREIVAPKRLTEPARLHWINLVMTVLGAGAGSYFGGSALAASYPDATLAAVILGYVSSAVLGGFAGFALSSFASVMRQALSEAHAASDRHHPRGRS